MKFKNASELVMQKVRNPQYCNVNITSKLAFWSVGAWLNLLHTWRVRSMLYACESESWQHEKKCHSHHLHPSDL